MLKRQLDENGLTNDILELMNFIKTVIEEREYGKFAFTRNLSMSLKLIGEIGQEHGITKKDRAFLHVHDIYMNCMYPQKMHGMFLVILLKKANVIMKWRSQLFCHLSLKARKK